MSVTGIVQETAGRDYSHFKVRFNVAKVIFVKLNVARYF